MVRIAIFCSVSLIVGGILLAVMLCRQNNESKIAETERNEDQPTAVHILFQDELLEIAAIYKTYGRVDDETRWAPYLCRMPMPPRARFSESEDVESHGDKLYYLFARDRNAYLDLARNPPKPGQVVIKESWQPKESDKELSARMWENTIEDSATTTNTKSPQFSTTPPIWGTHGTVYPFAKKDGQLYHADQPAGLYIMFKSAIATPETDDGWVYGTVTADGKEVTAGGKIESCIECHQEAPHDRLFGLSIGLCPLY